MLTPEFAVAVQRRWLRRPFEMWQVCRLPEVGDGDIDLRYAAGLSIDPLHDNSSQPLRRLRTVALRAQPPRLLDSLELSIDNLRDVVTDMECAVRGEDIT